MNTPLWFSNLIFWSAQVAVLVLTAAFLPRLLQIRHPRVLLFYWRAMLAICLLLPAIQPWHRLPSVAAMVIAPDSAAVGVLPASSPAVSHRHFPSPEAFAQVVGVVLLAGIAARFLILAIGLLRLRQLRQTSRPISLSAESAAVLDRMRIRVNTSAEFRLSPHIDSPVTFGFATALVLLPERFPSMNTTFQATIACHELLHVRRHDWAHHLAEEAIRTALWFHPAVAWLIARIRLAREQVVDLEVIRLTQERKPYLEALLEFATSRSRTAPIPAPPFLAERQLPERVALMLKEVRMSRARLIASLTTISFCLVLVIALVAWTFPLKAAPRAGQNPPQGGIAEGVGGRVASGVAQDVAQGVSGGVATGVTGGVEGGVGGDSAKRDQGDEPTVSQSSIWTDTVKRAPMVRQVRGLGKFVRAEDSGNLVATITLPEVMTRDVRPNQSATIATRKGLLANGHVSRISPSTSSDTRTVDVTLDAVPDGASAGLEVDGTIDIEKIDSVLQVGRPVHGVENTGVPLFKIVNNGAEAMRVYVKLGRSAVNTIEVLAGLKEGDKVILSDMSAYDKADRIHIK